ncbi:MAG: flap endonuclease-1 [archaeon]
MGVGIGEIIPKEERELNSLKGRKISIDTYNILYQFLSTIRQRNGELLKDSKGRTTSHLAGLLYRTGKLIENDIKPVYVFDGKPLGIKERELEERSKKRKEAKKKYEKALKEGKEKEARKQAQRSTKLEKEMIENSKKLLKSMNIPIVQAPGEGEAQASYMCKKGDVWASSSQDYDSLLYETPRLIRNLTITGKRKVPNKNKYVEVKIQEINLEKTLKKLEINQDQLIEIGILIGTDYNEGVKGIGPKTALKEVKKGRKAEEIYKENEQEPKIDPEKIRKIFKEPKVTDNYKLKWEKPDGEKMKQILIEEHDFSEKRVEKVIKKMEEKMSEETTQTHLGKF